MNISRTYLQVASPFFLIALSTGCSRDDGEVPDLFAADHTGKRVRLRRLIVAERIQVVKTGFRQVHLILRVQSAVGTAKGG